MANPIELAKTARSTLANALSALQSHPDAPEDLLEIAAPIAQSMGVLHRIEKHDGKDLSEVPAALDKVRGALDSLQQLDMDHQAVDDAMEHVAGSLAKLFALSKQAKAAKASSAGEAPSAYEAPEPVVPQPTTNPEPAEARQEGSASLPRPAPQPASPVLSAPAPVPANAPTEPQPQFTPRGTVKMDDASAIQAQVRSEVAKTESLSGGIDMPQTQPRADPMGATVPDPAAARAAQATAPAHAPAPAQPTVPLAPQVPHTAGAPAASAQRVPGMTDAPVPSTGAQHVEVELGAHSSSNFYKGLSGNDVVEHGGIFVQPYQIPAVGTAVALRVLLPGDLEFDADALVQWTRETRSGESDPGFGAKFTRISDAGRQLIYRYVRNREPMFYDDL